MQHTRLTELERQKALRELKLKEIERKNYLLSLSDNEASALSTVDKYDRCRYLREIEASAYMLEIKRKMAIVKPTEVVKKSFNKPTYKNFSDNEYYDKF